MSLKTCECVFRQTYSVLKCLFTSSSSFFKFQPLTFGQTQIYLIHVGSCFPRDSHLTFLQPVWLLSSFDPFQLCITQIVWNMIGNAGCNRIPYVTVLKKKPKIGSKKTNKQNKKKNIHAHNTQQQHT